MNRPAPASSFSRLMARALALGLPLVIGLFAGWSILEQIVAWPVALYFAGGAGLGVVLCALTTRRIENWLLTRHYDLDTVEHHHNLPSGPEEDPLSRSAEEALRDAFQRETRRD